jgi:hypothetical protein
MITKQTAIEQNSRSNARHRLNLVNRPYYLYLEWLYVNVTLWVG